MAENAKHTPGPWRVEDGTTLIWGACNPIDMTSYGMGYPIIECQLGPTSIWASTKGPTREEGYANAILAASAPELLEALKDARFMLYGNGPGNPKIDAAIAKAEGRE